LLSLTASPDVLATVKLWIADSEDRDFRNDTWNWQKVKYNQGSDLINMVVDLPEEGFRAFYADLIYNDPHNASQYSKSTRIYVLDTKKIIID